MEQISTKIRKEQLDWLEDRVKDGRFASVSHGVRVAIQKLMEVKEHGK